MRVKVSEIADAIWHGRTVTLVTDDGRRYKGKLKSFNGNRVCVKSDRETWWIPVKDVVSFDQKDSVLPTICPQSFEKP